MKLKYTDKIKDLISSGRKLQAVKEAYDYYHGISLVIAKDMIDSYFQGKDYYVTGKDQTDSQQVSIQSGKQDKESYSCGKSCSTSSNTQDKESHSYTKSCSIPNNNQQKNQNCKTIMTDAQKKQIEYIIGIDLGHGETSAAICPMQWETSVEQLDPAKDLDMGGNKKVMPSAITILDNGNAYIGDAAFNPEILKQAEVRVCFKQAPKDVNGEAEKIMIRFMHEVYKRIRENNKAILTDANHLVYIATPSGWDKPTQDLYVEMARMAELPIAGVTKESRAAFVRAQHDVTSGLGRNIDKGSIVFDMGSSTLDFTYMNKNLSRMVDHGYDCGASFIEKSIYAQQQEESDAIKQFETKYPKLIDYLIFEARKVKEQVYFDPSLKVKKTINFDDFIDDEDLEDERFKLTYNPGELNELLGENGYIKSIEDAMIDYKKNYIANQDIYGVFLTGGASRMDFIVPLVCKCWEVEPSQVYRDQDPSLTISQGVAEVARMDLRSDGMDVGLEEEINSFLKGSQTFDVFVEKFGHDLWDKVTDDIGGVITAWRDYKEDLSINSLQSVISDTVQESVSEFSSNAPAYVEESIKESTADIRAKVESIIAVYSSQGVDINLPNNVKLGEVNLSDINIDSVLYSISEKLKEDSNGWGAAIGGAAIGGAVAMLLGGPLTWLIGGGALISKWLFSEEKTEEEKRAEAMDRDLDSEQRAQVFNSIREEWDSICSSVADSIREALTEDKSIKNSINKVSKEFMQAYKDSLKSARILVD